MMTSVYVEGKFVNCDVNIQLGRYVDKSIAIRLIDPYTGEAIATPTVCLSAVNEKPADGNVFIKTWSENEGILEGLQKAGIVGDIVRKIEASHYINGAVYTVEVPFLLSPDDSRCQLL